MQIFSVTTGRLTYLYSIKMYLCWKQKILITFYKITGKKQREGKRGLTHLILKKKKTPPTLRLSLRGCMTRKKCELVKHISLKEKHRILQS